MEETQRGIGPIDMRALGARRACYFWVTMSNKELKEAIEKKLNEVPDSILQEVLDYLKGFQAKSPDEQKRVIGLKRILDEKRDLLLRLAK